jgi:uncharacterized protein
MSRRLTSQTTLENLKREAKRWLKALDEHDPEARARLERATPDSPAKPGLRHVQHALAREFDLPGWKALKDALTSARRDAAPTDLVTRFLDNACPDHHVRGGPDHVRARHTAMRLLTRYPDIARASFPAAIVCGELALVERMLAEHPELATQKSEAQKAWEPLLYLCFTRLPLPAANDNAVAIVRLLLEHGADPNVYFMAGDSRYTPLVGAIGEGEEDRPAHPHRDALVDLLLEHGANPYDRQVVYNIHFHGNVLWFLERIYQRALQLGRKADWDDPEWSMLNMGGYGNGARWHLHNAIDSNDLVLAEWCLAHGADPNAAPPPHPKFPKHSLYEEAMFRGHIEMADLLARYGAVRTEVEPQPVATLVAACMRLDRAAVTALLAAHPEYIHAPEPFFEAADKNRVDVAQFLLDLGWSPDVRNAINERPLHMASYSTAVDVAQWLIEHGAEIDPVEANWSNTPLGAAVYGQHAPIIELLAPYSRDFWGLTVAGKVDRLRQLIADDPERARAICRQYTPLVWLPTHDERIALEIAELYLALGADPSARNDKHDLTAIERAEKNGMLELTALLRG